MKDCKKFDQAPSGCDGDCAHCGIDYPTAEQMFANDRKENRKNMFFLVAVAVCMMAFVIPFGTLLNHFTGGKVTEKKTAWEPQVETVEYEA